MAGTKVSFGNFNGYLMSNLVIRHRQFTESTVDKLILDKAHVRSFAVLQTGYDFTTYLGFSHYVYKYSVSGCTFHYF